MGGSSSRSYTPTGGGGGADECDIEVTVDLQAPQRSVIQTLTVDSVLNVESRQAGQTASLVCVGPGGAVAGSLVFARMVQMIDCIASGNNYIAQVVSINGGSCRVHVHRAEGA
jgi:hypothetical protein